MPPIRSVSASNNQIQFTDHTGIQRTLLASAIPAQNVTIAQIETFINTVWIPANVTGYQMQVHVFSLNPLRCTVGTWNLGLTIPGNWWISA